MSPNMRQLCLRSVQPGREGVLVGFGLLKPLPLPSPDTRVRTLDLTVEQAGDVRQGYGFGEHDPFPKSAGR